MRRPTTLDSDADSAIGALHHVSDDSKPITPERALWLSVVALVWDDAWGITSDYQIFYSDPRFRRDEESMSRNSDAITVEAYRAQCRNWLIQDFGDFKTDRETVCDLAGLDPSVIQAAARAKLKAMKAGDQPTAEVISLDTMFARLVDAEGAMTPADIDAALDALAALESQAA